MVSLSANTSLICLTGPTHQLITDSSIGLIRAVRGRLIRRQNAGSRNDNFNLTVYSAEPDPILLLPLADQLTQRIALPPIPDISITLAASVTKARQNIDNQMTSRSHLVPVPCV